MIDIKSILSDPAQAVKQLRRRGTAAPEEVVKAVIDANQHRKETQLTAEKTTQALKEASQKEQRISAEMRWTAAARAHLSTLKEAKQQAELAHRTAKERLQSLLSRWPNLPHTEAPDGQTAADNQVVESPKTPPLQKGVPHWELLKQYGLVDFEAGYRVAGAGFPVYKGKGVKLLRGLIQWLLDAAEEAGYRLYYPPLVANQTAAFGTGQLPDKGEVMYGLTDQRFFLIPTAEVPLTNLYANKTFRPSELPLKLCAHTPCFRREAGSWGRQVRGLNRLRQFDKVELVEIHADRKNALEALEEMRAYGTQLLQQLGLNYRVLDLCTGDLGHTAARTYDLEVWSPGQACWLEVSSMSHFESYQARRIPLRYRPQNGSKLAYCHTLNGSAFGIPRIYAALLEQYQTPKGIEIPPVLRPYVGKLTW